MGAREPILFISNKIVNPNAGTESQLLQVIKHLPRDVFEPRLLVLQRSDYTDSGVIPCRVDSLDHDRLLDPKTWIAFWRYARRAASDRVRVAHIYFHDASVFGPPILRFIGVRSIISRRDLGYWYSQAYLRVLRISGKFADTVIVNSQAVGKVVCESERVATQKIKLIYNGYEATQSAEKTAVPELEHLAANGLGPILFLVANYRPLKRVEDAVRALSEVIKKRGNAQLVVIGAGDWGPVQTLAQQLQLSARVSFLGGRDDVKDCLRYGYLGLLCSESEGYSNSVVEYMQGSLPAIVSDVGGNSEAVINGETGFHYMVGDVEGLAAHILRLLQDPENARRMGEAGRRLARERHDLAHMITAHVDLYRSLIDGDTLMRAD